MHRKAFDGFLLLEYIEKTLSLWYNYGIGCLSNKEVYYMCEENITHKCIYCDATEDLSESDIVPDALTNARILNRNVCKIAHNNKFSDMFESKVIEALSFITNVLDVKTSKSSKYSQYDVYTTIDGKEYKARIRSERDIFSGQILTSVDKTQKLGAYDKIKGIAKGVEIDTIDVNNRMFDTRVIIHTPIFFDEAYYRTLSKIAFEWYCKENNVIGYHSEFDNIIKYITEGNGTCPVTIIQDECIYQLRSNIQNLGSHLLFGFESKDGKLNVVISLFGLLMYRIAITDAPPTFCKNNLLFLELRTDSKRIEFQHENYEAATTYYAEIFNPQKCVSLGNACGMKVMMPLSAPKDSILIYPHALNIIKILSETNNDISMPDEQIIDRLFGFLEEITQASLLHKKGLRRFVNEYFSNHQTPIIISPESCDRKKAFLFYVVYLIRKSEISELNDDALRGIVNARFKLPDATINLTEELSNALLQEILADKEYALVLENGATKIKAWNN